MKTSELMVGLFQCAAAACVVFVPYGQLIPPGAGRAIAFFVCAVIIVINAWQGMAHVMNALFGADGLVLDLDRHWSKRHVREEKALPVEKRGPRHTNPSRALRDRGAPERFRLSPKLRAKYGK